MKRNFDAPMMTLDNKPFDDASTLGKAVFTVMNSPLAEDANMNVDARMKQYGLLKLAHKGGVVELTSDEIATIKARAAKVLSTMTLGILCEMLETDYNGRPYQAPPEDRAVNDVRPTATAAA